MPSTGCASETTTQPSRGVFNICNSDHRPTYAPTENSPFRCRSNGGRMLALAMQYATVKPHHGIESARY